MELAKRLEGTGISVNYLHPGMIDSGIWRNVPFPLTLPMRVIKNFFKVQFKFLSFYDGKFNNFDFLDDR
jgi:hypothetical protein